MSIIVQVIAGFSLFVFTIATLLGFTIPDDKTDPFVKLKICINNTLKWRWLEKPFILTKMGVIIAFISGIIVIILS